MAISSHVRSGETVELALLQRPTQARIATLIQTNRLEAVRVVLPRGEQVALAQLMFEHTIVCIQGRVLVRDAGQREELLAGGFVHHPSTGALGVIQALEDSALLITAFPPGHACPPLLDPVDEASDESFPASDPPARTGVLRP